MCVHVSYLKCVLSERTLALALAASFSFLAICLSILPAVTVAAQWQLRLYQGPRFLLCVERERACVGYQPGGEREPSVLMRVRR